MLVYDKVRGEVVDVGTGEVIVDRVIDPGPEWRSYKSGARRCHVMYTRDPEPLRFFKGLVPRYVYEDAKYIMGKLKLGGRAGALAAIMYSCKRFGVPFNQELLRLGGVDRGRVYRVYRRLLEELGPPPGIDEAVVSQIIGVAVRLGKPGIASRAVREYLRLRGKYQGYRPTTLAAVALVRAGLPARDVAKLLNVSPSTLSKALKNTGAKT